MPVFTIETPSGKRLKIEAGDEATAMRGAQEWDAQNAPKTRPSNWDAADDYANAVGSGLTKGSLALVGSLGDAREMTSGVVDWGAQKLGASPETAALLAKGSQYLNPLSLFAPTTAQVTPQAVKDAPRPRSTGARIVETAAEMAPMMAMGPGGVVRKGVQTGLTAAATELLGPEAGLATAVITGGRGARAKMASREELVAQAENAKRAAYNAADQAGVTYTPQAFDELVNSMGDALAEGGASPMRHPRAVSMIWDIDKLRGQPQSLTQLDQIRQNIARDVAGAPDEAERHFGKIMMNKFDEFIDQATPTQVVAGDPQQAATLIRSAREANQRFRKLEAVSNAVTKAERRAESTGSGGNADNAIRQNIRGILDSERKSRGFSAEEKQLMDNVIRDSGAQKAVRVAGKLSPQGSGLMAALGVGGAMVNPVIGAPALVGVLAKPLAERMTRRKLDALVAALSGARRPNNNRRRQEDLARALIGAEAALPAKP